MLRHILLLAVVLTTLSGCATNDHERLESEMERVLPDGARQRGECNWASGFVENAPASLDCRFVVVGDIPAVAQATERRLRGHGYVVRVVRIPPEAPTTRLFGARKEAFFASVGLVRPGSPLDWQLGRFPVPPGSVGVSIRVSERSEQDEA